VSYSTVEESAHRLGRVLARVGDAAFCPVCFWTDDGRRDGSGEAIAGGPNGEVSLAEARLNSASTEPATAATNMWYGRLTLTS
jgi:Cysteine-rich CPCC